MALFNGTPDDDSLSGGEEDDSINGVGGNDTLLGGAGNDTIDGGAGNDSLTGGDGNDTLMGGAGADTLRGGSGNDSIDGGVVLDRVNYNDLNVLAYSDSASAVNVNLSGIGGDGSTGTGTVQDGLGGTDTVANVNFIVGSANDDTLTGSAAGIFEHFEGGAGNDIIDGGAIDAGTSPVNSNRATYVNAASSVTVDLQAGTATGGAGNDTLTNINHIRGSGFDDLLQGSDTTDHPEAFDGLAGNDTIDGRGGIDQVRYDSGTGAVVDLGAGTATDGLLGTDTLSNIENVRGSNNADQITGSVDANVLDGRGGSDFIAGGGGADTLLGNDGDDTLYGGAGIDTLNGGAGYDRVSYFGAAAGVVVNMAANVTSNDGDGASDVLIGIERVIGSQFDDSITGSTADDDFTGGQGKDTLDGGTGFDFVWYGNATSAVQVDLAGNATGGEGNDTLISIEAVGGSHFSDSLLGTAGDNYFRGDGAFGDTLGGSDTMNGLGGFDVVDYRDDPVGVTVNLQTGQATDGHGFQDTLVSIEEARGSTFNDVLTGSANLWFERFEGREGDDTIDGGAITDTLNQVNGNQVSYRFAIGGVAVDLLAGTATGAAGNDSLSNINEVRGSANSDSLWGSDRSDVTELFEGRDGDDLIDGRGGFDIARFDNATGGVTASLVAGTASGAGVGSDTLANVEGLWGSIHADILTGGNAANGTVLTDGLSEFLLGGGGNDTIDGGQGYDVASYQNSTSAVTVTLNDTADGTASDGLGGTDTLRNIEGVRGSAQNDTLTGSDTAAFESFEGREGNDVINGKGGLDRADYYRAKSGVTVNLGLGSALDGYGGTDTLSNIEDVRGSRDFSDILTGDGNANKLEGLGGNDTLDGGAGNDTLIGGDGDDNISGLAGNDSIAGSGGNDWLSGGLGNDSIDGGAGWDTASYGDATSGVIANLTTHLVTGGAGADTLAGIEALAGTNFNDNLTGDAGDNNLRGGAGNDTLTGGAGNDVLTGGLGSDTLAGGLGAYDMADYGDATAAVNVSLVSNTATGMGADLLSGIENLAGGNFNDTLIGDASSNYIQGNGGDDSLVGGAGFDSVGYAGTIGAVQVNLATNSATGAAGNDVLSGFEGIRGSSYDDTLIGNTGDNQFNAAQGDDAIDGDTGIDTAGYWEASGAVWVNLSTGASSGADGNDTLTGIENVVGSNFDDTITGDGGNNNLVGGLGNDSIIGGGGVDTVAYYPSVGGVSVNLVTGFVGGAESDTLGGVENVTGSSYDDTLTGDGNDNSFTGGLGNDSIQGGAGNDWANYYDAISVGVTANLESGAVTGGAGVDTLSGIEHLGGSSFADTLTGSAGSVNNTLRGEGGNDSLVGNDGNDYLTGGSGNDTINGGTGADTADYFFTDTSAAVVVNLALGTATGGGGTDTLTSIENVNGGNFNDVLTGDGFNNFLQGQGGNDTLTGAAGDDKLDGGLDNDSLVGGLGNDSLIGDAGNDTLLGNEGADTLRGGGGNDSLDGGLVTDRIGYSDANTAAYFNSTSAVNVDLSNVTGTGSTGSGTAQDGMAGVDTLVNISFIVGSDHDDTIVGSTARTFEMFEGGLGNDTIDGGAITDTLNGTNNNRATYVNATGAVTVDLEAHSATGGAGNDTLLNINQVRGGAGNDTLLGSNHTDYTETFEGRGGNDSIDGKDGFDIVRYDTFGGVTTGVIVNLVDGTASGANIGNDLLFNIEGVQGGSFNDTLIGGNALNGISIGDGKIEVFRGAGGSDSIDGGQGYDRVDYNTATTFVTVTLGGTAAGTANDGLGGTDTLVNIEAVRGSDFGDTLNGSDAGVFESFEGMAGADRIDGKLGVDRVDYGTSAAGVTVNLTNTATLTGGTAADGWGFTDTLFGIENVRGSTFNDSILGSSADNKVEAGTGLDTVDGAGGNDTLAVKGAFLDYLVQRPTVTDTRLVNATTGESVLIRNVEFIQFTDGTKTLLEIQGNSLSPNADNYVGDEDDNNIDSLAGNDTVSGLGGNDTLIGGAGIDSLIGGTGDDTYVVDVAADLVVEAQDEGADTVNVAFAAAGTYLMTANVENGTVTAGAAIAANITGNELDNVLTGNGAANILTGGDGNDTLDGGAGTDNLVGGAGDDTYVVNVATDVVNETLAGGGADTVNVAFTALGTYLMTLGVEEAFISTGTAGVNITGSADNNLITGNAAANLLNGAAGNDTLDGGLGNDTLDGGLGDDRVVLAGDIDEWIVARTNQADTTLTRSGQTVTIRAIDLVEFDDALVDMAALWNNVPTPFNDILSGSELDELIDGLAGNDTITGMAGHDTLIGGAGIDSLIGGTGDDLYVVDVLGDQIVESADEGADAVNVALTLAGIYTMAPNVENGTVTAGGTLTVGIIGNVSDNVLTGNANANALSGADGNDTLIGNAGNDTLNGGAGNDSLDGGIGTDSLVGGAGDDSYIINLTTDVVTEGLAAGTDTVHLAFSAAATYLMTLNVENADISNGTSGVNITGNVLANALDGNVGNNTLVGGDGNDTIAGHGGTDVVDGGLGTADLLVLSGSAEDYLITRPTLTQTVFSGAGVKVTVSNVEFVQFDAGGPQAYLSVVAQTGSPGNDALTGFGSDDTLDGGAGNDTVSGLGGDDTLFGGIGNDTLAGGTGTDILDGGVGVDTYVYEQGDGDDLIDQNDTVAGVIDRVVLTQTGLTAGQLTFTRGYLTYDDLVVNITQADESVDHVVIVGFFSNDAVSLGTIDQVQVVIDGVAQVYTQTMLAAQALLDGDGDHIFVGYNIADAVTGSAANDWISTGNGNDVVSAGDGDDVAFGGAGADQLNGGDGNDLLVGGAGADTMSGGAGSDTLTGGAGGDIYRIEAGGGDDVISESIPSLTDEQLQSGIGPIYVIGDGDAPLATDTDTLSFLAGIAEADVRATRSGNDLVFTIGGADTVTVANYFANGVATIERVLFASGATWSATAIRAKVLVPTDGDDEITGYLGGDRLNGLDGNDTLDGREGNDVLTGGDGNDVLTGGSGSDRFVFNVAPDDETNLDTIIDFQSGVDTIVLSAAVFTAFSGAVGTRVGLSDNLTYSNATGALAYDADGISGNAAVTIVIIGAGPHPASLGTDFVIGV